MTTLNIGMLTASQLVALYRRATGSERAAVYAAIVGSARCENVTLAGERVHSDTWSRAVFSAGPL